MRARTSSRAGWNTHLIFRTFQSFDLVEVTLLIVVVLLLRHVTRVTVDRRVRGRDARTDRMALLSTDRTARRAYSQLGTEL